MAQPSAQPSPSPSPSPDDYDPSAPLMPLPKQEIGPDDYDPSAPSTYLPGARLSYALPDGTKGTGTVVGPGTRGTGAGYAFKYDNTGTVGTLGTGYITGFAPPPTPPMALRPDFGQSVPARLAQGLVEEGTQAADAMTLGHAADIQAYTRALADRLGASPASTLALAASAALPGAGAQALGQSLSQSAQAYRPLFQAGIDQFAQENPLTSTAERFLGGALGFGAGTGAVQGAVGTAGKAIMPYVPQGVGQFLQGAGAMAQGINPVRALGLSSAYPAMSRLYNYLAPIAGGMLNGYGGAVANNTLGGPEQGAVSPDVGAAVGGVLGTIPPLANSIMNKYGPKALESIAQSAQAFGQKFGWTPTVKQLTPSPGWEGTAGFAAPYAPKDQIPNFTRALSNLVGEDTPSMTPSSGIVKRIYDNASQGFKDFANNANNDIQVDPALVKGLGQLRAQLEEPFPQGQLGSSEGKKQAEALLDKLANHAAQGVIPASDWMDVLQFTHQLRENLVGGSLNGGEFVNNLIDTISDAVKRNAPAGNAGAGFATWYDYEKLKELWKNAMVADRAVAATNGTGLIPPTQLLGIVKEIYPNYSKGMAGDMGNLAEMGQLLPELNNKGGQLPQANPSNATVAKAFAHSMGGALGGGLVAASLGLGPAALGAAGLAAAGLTAKTLAKNYFNSPEAANNLIRRSLGMGGIPAPYPQNMLNGWLASQNAAPNALGVQK